MQQESLPIFRYHADPLRSGNVEPSEDTCSCCGKSRGFGYYGTTFDLTPHAQEPDEICPWCIADGSASKRFSIGFVKGNALIDELGPEIIEEITCRTPAYSSWQEPRWLCHCEDACVFHGDLTIEEAKNPDWDAIASILDTTVDEAKETWPEYAEQYEPADPSIFKFVCRHCRKVFYQIDSH